MMLTLISGIVPPHWKFSMMAASILPLATAGWFWLGLNNCAAPKFWTSTRPLVAALTSLANCSRLIAVWCPGGIWWLMRMVYSAAAALPDTLIMASENAVQQSANGWRLYIVVSFSRFLVNRTS